MTFCVASPVILIAMAHAAQGRSIQVRERIQRERTDAYPP